MILWVKRAAAISSGILLAVVLYEHPALAVAGAILNLACVVDGRLPSVFGRLVGPSILVVNTAMSASAVLGGAPAILAMLTAATSLLTWNTGLFLQRWGDAPLAVQYQFLKQLGFIVVIGVGAGLSALILHGRLSLQFFPALLLMWIGGFLLLRAISQGSKKKN